MLKNPLTGWLASLLWLGCLCLPSPADARKGVDQGFVDLKQVLAKVCDGKRAKKQLRYQKDRFQHRLNHLQGKLRLMRQEYRKKPMPANARAKLRYKMQRGLLRLQTAYKQFSAKLRKLEAQATGRIIKKSRRLIRKIAERHKLAFVFEKAQSSLLYAHKNRDFTKELIKLYRNTHCRGAKGNKASPPSKKPGNKSLHLRLKELGIDTQ